MVQLCLGLVDAYLGRHRDETFALKSFLSLIDLAAMHLLPKWWYNLNTLYSDFHIGVREWQNQNYAKRWNICIPCFIEQQNTKELYRR